MSNREAGDRGRPWMVVTLPDWLQRITRVMFLDDLWSRWSCDQCEAMGIKRDVWVPRLWAHELSHTDEEWAAAGYDKQGTIDFHRYGFTDFSSPSGQQEKQIEKCAPCSGRGQISQTIEHGYGIGTTSVSTCPFCGGHGEVSVETAR